MGKVTESLPHDSYLVKVDGLGSLTQHTHKHFHPMQVMMTLPAPLPSSLLATASTGKEQQQQTLHQP